MKRGERRGALPDEEWLWLRDHLYCKSINQLFREYSEVFGSPYSTMDSFRAVLLRNDLFPITEAKPHDLVHNLIRVYYSGSWKWSFRGDEPQQSIIAEPHWLWKWHENSIKCPSGVSFRPFPRKLKEKQFNEDREGLDSGDSVQVCRVKRLHLCLSREQVFRGIDEEADAESDNAVSEEAAGVQETDTD